MPLTPEPPDSNQPIKLLSSEEHPSLMAMAALGLLYRLAGSHTFHLDDLQTIMNEYEGVRLYLDNKTNMLTFTLKAREPKK